MACINLFVYTGNLTRDAKLTRLPGGKVRCTYVIACDSLDRDEKGNSLARTDYLPVTTWGKQAENDAKYLKKGAQVAVQGEIRSWYNGEKGGFNFLATQVQYLGRATRSEKTGEPEPEPEPNADDHRAWLEAYNNP